MARSKSYFDPVDLKMDFPLMEQHLLEKWYKSGLVNKYLDKNKNSKKYFSFLDGPITANNPMGVHHAWGRTYKDLWQRFKNMQGYKQRFQNGFDCQGLWVEVEVEKELGLKSKKDIENLVPGNKKASISKFVELCRERVKKYSNIQTEQSKRLGYFMDWDNSYYTLSLNNNYMIWHFLKVCDSNGWIYKGNDVVPWCPRCETAISQHEILTEDYKDVVHQSIYFQLPIKDRDNEYLLVWTTTPWTIPANTAVSVDENKEYSLVEVKSGDRFWVLKDRISAIFAKEGKVVKTIIGAELVGLKYKAPFDDLPVVKKALEKYINMHQVVATDPQIMPISLEEGTGLIHTSTSTGEEDHKLGVKLGLPVTPAIDDVTNYLEGYGELTDKNAKTHPEYIFDYLKKKEGDGKKWIFAIEPYRHRYPICWRCKTELVWKLTDEWYISMDKKSDDGKSLRERMVAITKKIKWIPSFGLERELDWLKNMHDWLISKKNRYWGLALPIWECNRCNRFVVIGSYEELREKAVSGWGAFEGKTPHKPQIDEVRIKCPECGEIISRIEPVGNPWLDAGIVPFSTISVTNKATLFDGSTEKPLYQEDKKEWGKWYPADFITESFPGQFKNWFYSLIAMSAVLENKEPFRMALGFATLMDEKGRPMHKSLGNFIEFNEGADKIGVDVMRWIYVRQNPTENLLFGYKTADETRRRFHLKIWNIYNFFVTYATIDNWKPNSRGVSESILDKWIISRFNDCLDHVTKSLEKYDAFSASSEVEIFVDDLSNWYIRRSRDRVGPMAESEEDKRAFYQTVFTVLSNLSIILAPFTPYLSEIIYKNLSKNESVHLTNWPSLEGNKNDRLTREMLKIREIVEKVHAVRKEKGIPVRQPLLSVKVSGFYTEKFDNEILELAKDELNVKNLKIEHGKEIIELDLTITPELEEEAKARDLIRRIQEERKNMGLNLLERTNVTSDWLPESEDLKQKIMRKTATLNLQKGSLFKVVTEKN